MKDLHYKKVFLLLIIYAFLTGFINCRAQEVIATAAGYSESPSISLSWTLGESITETFVSDEIILTQGFNQSNLTITDISEVLFPGFDITAWPNPVKNVFTIKTGSENLKDLKAELYDLSGTKLLSEQISSGIRQINIERLPESEYILRICDSHQVIKIFRIIKN